MLGFSYWLNFARYVGNRYREDDCNRSAAALTYTSLFAVVPLMTLMYATLSMVPAMQSVSASIESFVFENFVPTTGHEVQAYLQQLPRIWGIPISCNPPCQSMHWIRVPSALAKHGNRFGENKRFTKRP